MTDMPSKREFIALIAVLFATIAFSIDAMLPALPQIAADLSPDAPNKAQLVVTAFVLGMGVGTFFTGPMSDTLGRKPVVVGGAIVYILASIVATQAESLEVLLAARLVQGLGAAAPRVVALAIVRDVFAGRQMAQIMSFVMMIFTLIPAMAPSMGAVIIAMSGWHLVFWAFALFSAISCLWVVVRLPETLPVEKRRPFSAASIMAALREMLTHPVVRLSIVAQGLTFGILFATISSIQPIYEVSFDMADSFPLWFGATALLAMSSSYLNSQLVVRLGMRFLVNTMLTVQVGMSGLMLALILLGLQGTPLFVAFFIWQFSLFFQAGMTLGNLNAIAMEPMGHIAGLAASISGAIATVMAVAVAAPIGLIFDGTPLPLAGGVFILAVLALLVMRMMARADAALPV